MALFVAQRLLVIQCGPMFEPDTWIDVAERRGHEVEAWHEPGGDAGEYLSSEPGVGKVWFNTAYTPVMQCRAIVHECAHAELAALASGLIHGEVPGYFQGHYCRAGFNDDTDEIGQRICRRVEAIVLNPVLEETLMDTNLVMRRADDTPEGERIRSERVEEIQLRVSLYMEQLGSLDRLCQKQIESLGQLPPAEPT